MSGTKIKRRFFAAVALLLTALMILLLPAQKIAAAEEEQETLYIKEIMLGYGKNADEAAKSLVGYEILKNGENYANLNEGSGKNTVVLLGYKTTANRDEAITDIAAMNMKGGYSFAEYEKLLEQYRDSQILPFVNRFMVTVKEYRDNYNGTNENNKLKALYVHDMLNMYVDDDSGMGLGDLFLKTTAEELGLDKYNALSDKDKKKYGCLTTILMQGQASTILFIEQMLTMAADTSDTTWLQRFQKITPDSLLESYMKDGAGETDAMKALARDYENSARLLADKWLHFRNALLDYENSLNAEDGGTVVDKSDADILANSSDAEEEEEEEESEESADVTLDENSLAQLTLDTMYVEGAAANAAIDSTSNVKTAFIYNYLKAMEYNGKTMYDFFTQSYEDINKDNFFALYPLAASLTDGQTAGMEFLTLEQLVAVGSTDNDSYKNTLEAEKEILKNKETVSVYAGVNRELYSDKVALTDKAMRDNAANAVQEDDKMGSIVTRAIVLGTLSALLIVPTVLSINAAMQSFEDLHSVYYHEVRLNETAEQSLAYLKEYSLANRNEMERYYEATRMKKLVKEFGKEKFYENVTDSEGVTKLKRTERLWNEFKKTEQYKAIRGDYDKIVLKSTTVQATENGTDIVVTFRSGETKTFQMPFRSEFANADGSVTKADITKIIDEIETKKMLKEAPAVGTKWGAALKTTVATAFSLLFLGLTMYDIYITVNDLDKYYNADMTLVPKYIVDRTDLTMVDENGKTIIIRNEEAYYQAIGSNRAEDHKFYGTMNNYGDVNAAEGKQWLVLYTNNNTAVHTPVLADSLKVVTGRSEPPEGYTTGIHMFGDTVAVNMTNSRYTYDDKLKGIYVYYKHAPALSTSTGTGTQTNDSGEAPVTSSAIGAGSLAVAGICGLAAGFVLGLCIMLLIKKKKVTEKE